MQHGDSAGWPKKSAPEYRVWLHLRGRCNNHNDAAYRHYGGRGIRVCKEWDNYPQFLADVGRRPSSLHTLDRLDNDKGYEPGNCAWTTRTQQARNRRSTRKVSLNGEQMSLAEACERTNAHYGSVKSRLYRGWTLEDALIPRT